MYPFSYSKLDNQRDQELVSSALEGNRKAVEALIAKHQRWIYNIVLRMIWHPQDAEDICQDIIIKVLTHLSTFQSKSSFRTWLYRIVFNHILNLKKSEFRYKEHSFEQYGTMIDRTPDLDLPDPTQVPVDLQVIIDEIKISCMTGMLLCLDPQQRLVFILSCIFGMSHQYGSIILSITSTNYRQQLCRARRQLANFMDQKCGLIRSENPCHCAHKTQALIMMGYVDPLHLLFKKNVVQLVKDVITTKKRNFGTFIETRCVKLFREHPLSQSPDYIHKLKDVLDSPEFVNIFSVYN